MIPLLQILWILSALLVGLFTVVNGSTPLYPPCTSNAYSEGFIDFEAMIYNCSANVPSPMQPPSYYPNSTTANTYSPTVVEVQVVLNNLIRVDDQTNQFKLDFLLRLKWVDPRWTMPDLWRHINANAGWDGIDIRSYVHNQNELNVWLPDLVFSETNDMSIISEFIKFMPNGTFFWSRHMVAVFIDATMDYHDFPSDMQNFTVTLQSYSYSNQFVVLDFISDTTVVLQQDYAGDNTIEHNELWDYGGYYADIQTILFPTFSNPNRQFSTIYYSFYFDRQSQGFVYRYALPIMIFLIIVGISFWADLSQRVDVTLQIVLVVAALYLIIGQAIPVVGYLTSIDIYVTTVFALLTMTVWVHLLTIIFDRKKEKYPLQLFAGEALVLFFRILWIPCSVLFFMVQFQQYNGGVIAFFILSTIGSIVYAIVYSKTLLKTFHTAIYNLRLKYSYFKILQNPEVIEKPGVESIPYATHKEKLVLTKAETVLLQWMSKVELLKDEVGGEIMKKEEYLQRQQSMQRSVSVRSEVELGGMVGGGERTGASRMMTGQEHGMEEGRESASTKNPMLRAAAVTITTPIPLAPSATTIPLPSAPLHTATTAAATTATTTTTAASTAAVNAPVKNDSVVLLTDEPITYQPFNALDPLSPTIPTDEESSSTLK